MLVKVRWLADNASVSQLTAVSLVSGGLMINWHTFCGLISGDVAVSSEFKAVAGLLKQVAE